MAGEWAIEEPWYLKNADTSRVGAEALQALQIGAQLATRKAETELRAKELSAHLKALELHQLQYDQKQQQQTLSAEGFAALSGVVSKHASADTLDQPQAEAEFWQTAGKYPWVQSSKAFDDLSTIFQRSRDYKNRAALAASRLPVAQQNVDKIAELEDQAHKAELGGDTEGATRLRYKAGLLKETIEGPSESTTIGYDDQGRAIVTTLKGPAANQKPITTATQGKFEQNIWNNRKNLDAIGDLADNLRWQDLGVAGVFGENVLDKFLPQFGVNSADVGRIDNRTKLKTFVQGSLRTISSDSRFSNEDRQRVEAITPSSGALENEQHAKTVLKTIARVFARRNIRDLEATGKIVPGQPISPDTLKQMANEEIGAAVEMKLLPYDQAMSILKARFE